MLCNISSSIYIYIAVNVNNWKIYENNKFKCIVINKAKVVSEINKLIKRYAIRCVREWRYNSTVLDLGTRLG
jgi:hypothetical protein